MHTTGYDEKGEETRWRNVYVLTFFILIFSDEPENKYDDFDDTPSSKYSYKDDDEEFTSVERTHTTRTEKITTNRRTRSVGKKLDLGASSTLGKDKSDTTVLIIIKYHIVYLLISMNFHIDFTAFRCYFWLILPLVTILTCFL